MGDAHGDTRAGLGAYATARNVPAKILFALPDDISDETAAAALLWRGRLEFRVERCARVEPGWTVLVHACGGRRGADRGAVVEGDRRNGDRDGRACKLTRWRRRALLERTLAAPRGRGRHRRGAPRSARRRGRGSSARRRRQGYLGKPRWLPARRRGLVVSFGNASGPVEGVNLGRWRGRARSMWTSADDVRLQGDAGRTAPPAALRLFLVLRSGACVVEINQRFCAGRRRRCAPGAQLKPANDGIYGAGAVILSFLACGSLMLFGSTCRRSGRRSTISAVVRVSVRPSRNRLSGDARAAADIAGHVDRHLDRARDLIARMRLARDIEAELLPVDFGRRDIGPGQLVANPGGVHRQLGGEALAIGPGLERGQPGAPPACRHRGRCRRASAGRSRSHPPRSAASGSHSIFDARGGPAGDPMAARGAGQAGILEPFVDARLQLGPRCAAGARRPEVEHADREGPVASLAAGRQAVFELDPRPASLRRCARSARRCSACCSSRRGCAARPGWCGRAEAVAGSAAPPPWTARAARREEVAARITPVRRPAAFNFHELGQAEFRRARGCRPIACSRQRAGWDRAGHHLT